MDTLPDSDRNVLVFEKAHDDVPVIGYYVAGLKKWSWLGHMHAEPPAFWCDIPDPRHRVGARQD